ncbi:hypothetical protein [Halobaculum limi]|uniref:hypothetical protein n=1 Tax=Halobaculum limi TaxID=3031916 RepID=UPI002404F846|nr:hypothetical protein [Halobaculum sp. YSMS11]
MVLRTLLLVLGVVEFLRPRQLVDFWMRLAVRGDDPVELREWVYSIARLEGVVIVLWVLGNALRRARSSDDQEAVAVVDAA